MIATMRWHATALLPLLFVLAATPAGAAERALVLDVDGVIGPAIADYIMREIKAASPGADGLIVLRMNTPGGLDSSMREIDARDSGIARAGRHLRCARGARAASAGTYIAYASAIAAMAPGTNIGAATPMQLGGNPLASGGGSERKTQTPGKTEEPTDTETRKIVNDAVGLYPQPRRGQRSQRRLGGRRPCAPPQACRRPKRCKLHVIDVVAADVPDLLRQIDGRTVTVAGKPLRLATAGLEVARSRRTGAPNYSLSSPIRTSPSS